MFAAYALALRRAYVVGVGYFALRAQYAFSAALCARFAARIRAAFMGCEPFTEGRPPQAARNKRRFEEDESTVPLLIVQNDITRMNVDAIVNAANTSLLGGGGVDGCIHRAAGVELLKECRTLHGCPTGKAKITKGYKLPCRYVIHAVGPRWIDGRRGERELLRSCYESSLALAVEHDCQSIAFPLISSGIYGYPKDRALNVAVDAISAFLRERDLTVYIVVFDKASYQIDAQLLADVTRWIGERRLEAQKDGGVEGVDGRVEERRVGAREVVGRGVASELSGRADEARCVQEIDGRSLTSCRFNACAGANGTVESSFSEWLRKTMIERGKSEVECYRKANVDRRVLSEILADDAFLPSKSMVIAFALALDLSLAETNEILVKTGFSLSRSSLFDCVVEYFIQCDNRDISVINEVLFAFDQRLIGE